MAAKPKSVVIIGILAVVIAAVASFVLYNYLKGQEAKVKEAVATEKVVVATEEIPAGSSIGLTQVKTTPWPTAHLPQGTFPSTDKVTGRVAVDRYVPGEPIVEAKLIPKEGPSGILTYKIPLGHRAMTVAVDQVTGVAGFITPGNKVDVVLTTTPMPGAQQPISKIVLQDVPVLAIGQIIEQQKDGKPLVVPTVTMDVTPDDTEKLAVASTQGRLQLVLRRAGDIEVAKTTGATVTKVISGTNMGAVSEARPKAAQKTKTVKKSLVKEKGQKVENPEEVITVEIWRREKKAIETFKMEK